MWKSREFWAVLILGLSMGLNDCDGRAVNISNTWTLPHDGFTVFYRFFRDQISWFEADAVCQFHHANLVTVDSPAEFDAAREFLRVLDVTEPVWIGLMRPQNSERFTWSNSKPLTSTSEYWAESLPLIDAPLCAVIDPIRDYRWHALRCGGPETASFLCEMNVPSWAEECVLRDIPALTIQYMADSGTVEITKDCGTDEGAIHQVCRGKQDQEKIIKNLICKNEQITEKLPTKTTTEMIHNMNTKTMKIFKNIPSDNNEDNNIHNNAPQKTVEKHEQETENPVQKLIEQFNVEELMQADQSASQHIPDEIPKPQKKLTKKVKADKKNKKSGKKMLELPTLKGKNIALEDMMMGDQPAASSQSADDDDLNEINEPLPHTKKSLPQDLKHIDKLQKSQVKITKPTITTTILIQPTAQIKTETTEVNSVATTSTTTDLIDQSHLTTVSANENTEIIQQTSAISGTEHQQAAEILSTSATEPFTTPSIDIDMITTPKAATAATIGHPMHPQQPRSTIITEETAHQHIKETNDNHFIPPMLMVKSHYTSPKSGAGHNTYDQQQKQKSEPSGNLEVTHESSSYTTSELTTSENHDELNTESHYFGLSSGSISSASIPPQTTNTESNSNLTTQTTITISTIASSTSVESLISSTQHDQQPNFHVQTLSTSGTPTTIPLDLLNTNNHHAQQHHAIDINIGNPNNLPKFLITTSPPEHSAVTVKIDEPVTSSQGAAAVDNLKLIIDDASFDATSPATDNLVTATIMVKQLQETNEGAAVIGDIINGDILTTFSTETLAHNNSSVSDYEKNFSFATQQQQQPSAGNGSGTEIPDKTFPSTSTLEHHPTKVKPTNFSNDEILQPYKPNRRRSLTKPETTSYLKKILG